LRPPATLNQARRGSAARGCNSTGVGRGGGGRGLPLSSRKRGGEEGGGQGNLLTSTSVPASTRVFHT